MTGPAIDATHHRPIDDEIQVQLRKLEQVVLLGSAATALGGSLICLGLAVTIDRRLGLSLAAVTAGFALWFLLMRLLLGRGIATGAILKFDPIVESLLPSCLLLVEVSLQPQPLTQLTSAVPLVYGLVCVLAVLRLRSRLPMQIGLLCGLQYLAIIQFVIVPILPADLIASGRLSASILYVQPAVVLLIGCAGELVSVALRHVVRRAHGELRARDLFGKYEIGDRIAAGGMGVVFRARYRPEGGFKRDVAVKVIHDQLALEPEFIESFRAEAELAARLTHPNVVQVHDFGKINDTYFVAMEYVDGWTLLFIEQRCRDLGRRVPTPLLALILRDICLALQFAHSEVRDDDGQRLHVIHRDVSPSNVMITRGGMTKLTDFGVAKVLGSRAFTRATTLTGKLAYMSPEQAGGGAVDERADLFCLGIIGWEALVGQTLFRKPTDAATLAAVLNQSVVAPSQLRPELAPHWDGFIARALERAVEKRFASASEMVAALDAILAAEGVPAPGELTAWLAELTGSTAPASDQRAALLSSVPTLQSAPSLSPVRPDASADSTRFSPPVAEARRPPPED